MGAIHRQLIYTCPDDGSKKWVWAEDNMDMAVNPNADEYDKDVLTSDSKLTEPQCNAPDLKLDKDSYNQEGLLITCTGDQVSDELEAPTVTAENECLLLCDFYPSLKFFPDWKKYESGVNLGERV